MSAMSELAITLATDWVYQRAPFLFLTHRSGRWYIVEQKKGLTLWEGVDGRWEEVAAGFDLALLVAFVDKYGEPGRVAPLPERSQSRPWFRPRRGEVWLGRLGLFWSRSLKGVELPSGRWIGFGL